ncbi:hypothetical protein pdam_00000850, partial [Pocillopora damicornis]
MSKLQKTAILPLDIITTISLQCVGGAKLMVDAGDGSVTRPRPLTHLNFGQLAHMLGIPSAASDTSDNYSLSTTELQVTRSIMNKNDVLKQIPVKGWIALAAKNCPSPRQLILGFLSSQLAAGLAIC